MTESAAAPVHPFVLHPRKTSASSAAVSSVSAEPTGQRRCREHRADFEPTRRSGGEQQRDPEETVAESEPQAGLSSPREDAHGRICLHALAHGTEAKAQDQQDQNSADKGFIEGNGPSLAAGERIQPSAAEAVLRNEWRESILVRQEEASGALWRGRRPSLQSTAGPEEELELRYGPTSGVEGDPQSTASEGRRYE
ncbi:hypothetical protein L596_004975 [Steinernema carpocapsae]|uniref:Uncharacterized protein n=1 Tax=Steinernema carpocapsae TaxID=34508 RepID=A0A4U8UXM1_STECR|nr:hypothetical protein L596_004975 [Steinernema carpocapsae]